MQKSGAVFETTSEGVHNESNGKSCYLEQMGCAVQLYKVSFLTVSKLRSVPMAFLHVSSVIMARKNVVTFTF